jgi:poly(3-hydroxybutyrate) depolymerase
MAKTRVNPLIMKQLLLAILFFALTAVADAVTPPYYAMKYEASDKPGELAMAVTYTLWVPPGARTLRGVIVHQHGCGVSSAKTGLTAAYDLHWQALAKKWNCALLGPAYHLLKDTECRKWCDPRNGSDTTFQRALTDLAKQTQHPELATAPWCLWGHSGGAFWSSLMLTLHPEQIAAIFFRSGSAFGAWSRGEIPTPALTPACYTVPFLFIGGVKEAQDKIHGPPRLADQAMWKLWREQGAPGGMSSDPLSGHECGDSRYLAIAFFDACLKQRLSDQGLKPAGKGVTIDDSWLPDEDFANVWAGYNKSGRPSDTTPPPAPTNVRLAANGELTWSAEADLESGLGGFIIERDGQEIGRLPEKPAGKIGTPLFQGLSGGDTPVIAQPPMRFIDSTVKAGGKHDYRVTALNSVGLRSAATAAKPEN